MKTDRRDDIYYELGMTFRKMDFFSPFSKQYLLEYLVTQQKKLDFIGLRDLDHWLRTNPRFHPLESFHILFWANDSFQFDEHLILIRSESVGLQLQYAFLLARKFHRSMHKKCRITQKIVPEKWNMDHSPIEIGTKHWSKQVNFVHFVTQHILH